jgi:hypothetical protein
MIKILNTVPSADVIVETEIDKLKYTGWFLFTVRRDFSGALAG